MTKHGLYACAPRVSPPGGLRSSMTGFRVLATTGKADLVPSTLGWRVFEVPTMGIEDASFLLKSRSEPVSPCPASFGVRGESAKHEIPNLAHAMRCVSTAFLGTKGATKATHLMQFLVPVYKLPGRKSWKIVRHYLSRWRLYTRCYAPGGVHPFIYRCVARAPRATQMQHSNVG